MDAGIDIIDDKGIVVRGIKHFVIIKQKKA